MAINLTCSIFFWNKVFILLLNQGGFLSSHTIISRGIKLLRILRIVLLKISISSLILVFENALSQLNSLMARLISPVFASL